MMLLLFCCSINAQEAVKDTIAGKELLKGQTKPDIRLQDYLKKESAQPLNNYRKRWMDFDTSLPSLLPGIKPIYTLQVYKPNTPFDWDPVYKKKIVIDKERLKYKSMRLEEYRNMNVKDRTPFMNSHCIGPVEKGSPYNSGHDLMLLFTRKFWSFKKNARINKTEKALKNYDAVNPIHPKKKEEDSYANGQE